MRVFIPPIVGLVLSGGYSRRMGRDKGSIKNSQGKQWVHAQADTLGRFMEKVFVSCREEQADDYAGPYPFIFDKWDSHGPMTGLLSALVQYPGTAFFVVGVDLFPTDDKVYRQLIEARSPCKWATIVIQPDGYLQPLMGIWEPTSKEKLEAAWKEGNFSLRHFLQENQHHVTIVPVFTELRNANEPPFTSA